MEAVAAIGGGTGPERVHGVVADGGVGRGARAGQPAVALQGRAQRRAAHGKVLGEALLDHYVDTLGEIAATGFLAYWQRELRPYLRAAAAQFAPGKESLAERLLRRK